LPERCPAIPAIPKKIKKMPTKEFGRAGTAWIPSSSDAKNKQMDRSESPVNK
jgi:hypothetical protein